MRWEITKNPFEQIESGALATYSPDNNFRDRTRESSLQQKLKSWFFEIKEVSLREKTAEKKRMTLICGLAIILPIYAIQNQELPEVEMFCRHTIGGYQFLKFYEILLKFMMNGKY